MSNTYRYRPLVGKDAMRVVKVQGSPDPDARLVCELVHTTLTEPLPYRAISYTWEGQAPTEDIRLEGCSLKVTKNAEAALKRFRPRNAAETTLLWIDSLCINQSADGMPERNHQVGIMGQIYAAADEVLVFLDHSRMRDFPRHRRVFKWLQEVANVPTIFDLEQRKAKLYALFSEMNPPEGERVTERAMSNI